MQPPSRNLTMNEEIDRRLAEVFAPPFDESVFLKCLPDTAHMAPFIDFVMRRLLPRYHHTVFWGDRMLTLDKSMGFLDDPQFRPIWERVRGAHTYDQYD